MYTSIGCNRETISTKYKPLHMHGVQWRQNSLHVSDSYFSAPYRAPLPVLPFSFGADGAAHWHVHVSALLLSLWILIFVWTHSRQILAPFEFGSGDRTNRNQHICMHIAYCIYNERITLTLMMITIIRVIIIQWSLGIEYSKYIICIC